MPAKSHTPSSPAADMPIDSSSAHVSQQPTAPLVKRSSQTASLVSSQTVAPIKRRDSHRSITAGVCEQFAPQVERVPSSDADEKRSDDLGADADDKRALGDAEKASEDEAAAPAVDVLPNDATDYPDGGYGWVVVACCCALSSCTSAIDRRSRHVDGGASTRRRVC